MSDMADKLLDELERLKAENYFLKSVCEEQKTKIHILEVRLDEMSANERSFNNYIADLKEQNASLRERLDNFMGVIP